MKTNHLGQITCIVVVLTLAGCTALKLRDANDQLTTYYYAKLEAEKARSFPMIESAVASLNTLSENAAAQANEETNVLNQIAFYRIATTAAWQAGDTRVLEYGQSGQALCRGDAAAKAPRDCGMMAVIPSLASVDEKTRALDKLQARVTASDWQRNTADKENAESIYGAYRDAFNTLIEQRPVLQSSGAHAAFLNGVDRNLGTLLCSLIDDSARGLLGLAGSDLVNAMDAPVKKMKCALRNAKVDPGLAPCIRNLTPQSCS